jgi:hypothetical protein
MQCNWLLLKMLIFVMLSSVVFHFNCRLGENKGPCCAVACFRDGKMENRAEAVDIDDMLDQQHEQRNTDWQRFQQMVNKRTFLHSPEMTAPSRYVFDGQAYYQKQLHTPPRSFPHPMRAGSAGRFGHRHNGLGSSPKGDPFHWVRGTDLVRA